MKKTKLIPVTIGLIYVAAVASKSIQYLHKYVQRMLVYETITALQWYVSLLLLTPVDSWPEVFAK